MVILSAWWIRQKNSFHRRKWRSNADLLNVSINVKTLYSSSLPLQHHSKLKPLLKNPLIFSKLPRKAKKANTVQICVFIEPKEIRWSLCGVGWIEVGSSWYQLIIERIEAQDTRPGCPPPPSYLCTPTNQTPSAATLFHHVSLICRAHHRTGASYNTSLWWTYAGTTPTVPQSAPGEGNKGR